MHAQCIVFVNEDCCTEYFEGKVSRWQLLLKLVLWSSFSQPNSGFEREGGLRCRLGSKEIQLLANLTLL